MKEFEQPAIVRTSRAELEQEIKGLWGEFQRKAEGLGKKLSELRDQCAADAWLPLLEKLGIPRRTASELIRRFKAPAEEDMGRSAHAGQDPSPDSESPPTPDEPEEEADPMEPTPEQGDAWEPEDPPAPPSNKSKPILCRRCSTMAHPVKNCPQCAEARADRKGRNGKADPGPKAGSELFSVKQFDAPFGQLVRAIDDLGKAYKAKESAEAQKLRGELRKYKEEFTAWYKKLTGGKK